MEFWGDRQTKSEKLFDAPHLKNWLEEQDARGQLLAEKDPRWQSGSTAEVLNLRPQAGAPTETSILSKVRKITPAAEPVEQPVGLEGEAGARTVLGLPPRAERPPLYRTPQEIDEQLALKAAHLAEQRPYGGLDFSPGADAEAMQAVKGRLLSEQSFEDPASVKEMWARKLIGTDPDLRSALAAGALYRMYNTGREEY
jgi:hypothetical protein